MSVIFPDPIFSEKSKKAEGQNVTPEEKLFRVIAAANRQDSEIEQLIERFAEKSKRTSRAPWVQKTAEACEGFYRLVGDHILLGWQELKARPPLVRGLVLTAVVCVLLAIIAGRKIEKNFYYYSDRSGDQSGPRAAVNAPGNVAPAQITSSVKVPAADIQPYKLVGISWDAKGLVAMIETSESGRAQFVRQGDSLPGEVKVLEVKESTVMLSSGGRKWQLS